MEVKTYPEFVDLAPNVVRKRLVIEGIYKDKLTDTDICDYMVKLSDFMNMTIVSQPSTLYEPAYGVAAYMCWKESGMHVYTWTENETRPNFFSIDIYTCKDYELEKIIDFTKKVFEKQLTHITWRE